MVNDWAPGKNNYRKRFLALEPDAALRIILFGMGSLSLGELAGERLNVSLLAHSQEDEQSCYSENKHVDANEKDPGIQNIYLGHYQRIDGSVIKGPSVADLVAQSNSELAQKFANQMQTTMKKALVITNAARAGEAFDQQIKAGNKIGNERIRAMIIALKNQAATLQNIANEIGIKELSPQSSDSL
jgi:putative iron-regulated protein